MPLVKPALLAALALLATSSPLLAQINTVQAITPTVYFHQGDPRRGHSNNGWIILEDYVVVIDANYPSGAKEVYPKVRASTDKPVKFVVDTHHHPDHAFGNEFWTAAGAVAIAHLGALESLKNSGSAWEIEAKNRPDVAASKLKLPSLVYPDRLVFADGPRTVELRWLGVAHTRGDTFVWLPQEKILFTGDCCVNGPNNFLRDSNVSAWIQTLEAAKIFGAQIVCPGHGPMGGPEVIVDQQGYFIELQRGVKALLEAKKTPAEVKAAVPELGAQLRKIAHIARYVPTDQWFVAHVDKVFQELGGQPLPK